MKSSFQRIVAALLLVLTLQICLVSSQSTFTSFRSQMEAKVQEITTKMTSVYTNRCNSTLVNCESKSYNYCQGTAEKTCIQNFPKPDGCVDEGGNLASHSAVRFPTNVNANTLSQEQRQFVCTSAELQPVFNSLKDANDGSYTFTYFGTALGSFRNFPSTKAGTSDGVCEEYDPRFRPWYVTGTSSGKNVIVIIDTSGSMSNSGRMATAKSAAKAVVGTFSNNDFVGVIKFSGSARALVSTKIQRATTGYKASLDSQIDGLLASGATNYELAISLGFDMLAQATSDEFGAPCPDAENVFLFLTDGQPIAGAITAADLQAVIDGRNANFQISLFTYGMGSDSIDTSIIRTLACNNKGIYFAIPSTASSSQLLTQMRGYYTYISEGVTVAQSMWTQPYTDAFGFGTVVTVSFPAYYTENSVRKILGVAGIDVSVDYISSKYGIGITELEKQLLNNAPCYSSTLTACQIEDLRVTKCGTTCPTPNTQATCATITSDLFLAVINTDTSICCGLTIGALVGIIIGSIVGVIIIVIIVVCLVKHARNRAALNNTSFESQNKPLPNTVVISQNYGQVPPNQMNMNLPPQYQGGGMLPPFNGQQQYGGGPNFGAPQY